MQQTRIDTLGAMPLGPFDDTIDGHRSIDAVGGLWNVDLGYSCTCESCHHRAA